MNYAIMSGQPVSRISERWCRLRFRRSRRADRREVTRCNLVSRRPSGQGNPNWCLPTTRLEQSGWAAAYV